MNNPISIICKTCLERYSKCTAEMTEDCCISQLKVIKPESTPAEIFEYCCITMCGFQKHDCDRCVISISNVIKFKSPIKTDLKNSLLNHFEIDELFSVSV